MKAIALLLSFLVLASIGTPCDDESENKEQTELTKEHEDEPEEDFCSPFCACQCCKTQTYQAHLIEIDSTTEKAVLISEQHTHYQNDWVFREDQPPRQF